MGFVVSEAGIDGRVWEVLGQQSVDFGQHVHISLFGGGPHIVGRYISGVIYPIDLVVLPDVIEGTQNEAFGAVTVTVIGPKTSCCRGLRSCG